MAKNIQLFQFLCILIFQGIISNTLYQYEYTDIDSNLQESFSLNLYQTKEYNEFTRSIKVLNLDQNSNDKIKQVLENDFKFLMKLHEQHKSYPEIELVETNENSFLRIKDIQKINFKNFSYQDKYSQFQSLFQGLYRLHFLNYFNGDINNCTVSIQNDHLVFLLLKPQLIKRQPIPEKQMKLYFSPLKFKLSQQQQQEKNSIKDQSSELVRDYTSSIDDSSISIEFEDLDFKQYIKHADYFALSLVILNIAYNIDVHEFHQEMVQLIKQYDFDLILESTMNFKIIDMQMQQILVDQLQQRNISDEDPLWMCLKGLFKISPFDFDESIVLKKFEKLLSENKENSYELNISDESVIQKQQTSFSLASENYLEMLNNIPSDIENEFSEEDNIYNNREVADEHLNKDSSDEFQRKQQIKKTTQKRPFPGSFTIDNKNEQSNSFQGRLSDEISYESEDENTYDNREVADEHYRNDSSDEFKSEELYEEDTIKMPFPGTFTVDNLDESSDSSQGELSDEISDEPIVSLPISREKKFLENF